MRITPKTRRALRALAKMTTGRRTDPLAERAALARAMQACARGGRVWLCQSGYDCDWTFGQHARQISAVLVVAEREIREIYDGAEGPISVWFASNEPTASPDQGRNLVEEAFENGHQHVVRP